VSKAYKLGSYIEARRSRANAEAAHVYSSTRQSRRTGTEHAIDYRSVKACV
jgi:hypothetical protein